MVACLFYRSDIYDQHVDRSNVHTGQFPQRSGDRSPRSRCYLCQTHPRSGNHSALDHHSRCARGNRCTWTGGDRRSFPNSRRTRQSDDARRFAESGAHQRKQDRRSDRHLSRRLRHNA
jgi:hypothetical protein